MRISHSSLITGLKGIIVNQTYHSWNEGSLEIMSKVLFSSSKIWEFIIKSYFQKVLIKVKDFTNKKNKTKNFQLNFPFKKYLNLKILIKHSVKIKDFYIQGVPRNMTIARRLESRLWYLNLFVTFSLLSTLTCMILETIVT